MVMSLLKGGALTAYTNIVTEATIDTEEKFDQSLSKLVEHVFPTRALRIQLRYMRKAIVKPISMTVKEFFDRFEEVTKGLRIKVIWI